MELLKVLIFDEKEADQRMIEAQLKGLVTIIRAMTIQEAEIAFEQNQKLALIAMGTSFPSHNPESELLTQRIRARFNGPMLVIYTIPSYGLLLKNAGCNYECPKIVAGRKIIELLGLCE